MNAGKRRAIGKTLAKYSPLVAIINKINKKQKVQILKSSHMCLVILSCGVCNVCIHSRNYLIYTMWGSVTASEN